MARRQRVTLAPCVYQDEYGVDTIVHYRKLTAHARWPRATELETLTRWVARARSELMDRAAQTKKTRETTRGTLTADVAAFLKDRKGLAGYAADCSHLKAWTVLYGRLRRTQITTKSVNRAISDWRQANASDQTVRHRCRVLRVLWKHLDGKHARTPIDDAHVPKKPHPHPVGVPLETLRTVLTNLDPAKPRKKGSSAKRWPQGALMVRVRYQVLATTLQRPVQLKRAQPADVDLQRGTWIVRSAKNAPSHVVYLNRDMRAAWDAFMKADAWGTFNTHWYRTRIREAGWPATISTYNYRHAGAMDALDRGASLGDVQGLLGHREIETTRRVYGPLSESRQQQISAQMEGRLPPTAEGGTHEKGTDGEGQGRSFPKKSVEVVTRRRTAKMKLVKTKSA